jgi:ABC-type antimicrobial peptide transport system permease subunit
VALDFDVEPRGMSDGVALGREVLLRVEQLPGVLAAAMSNRAPVDQSTPSVEIQVPTGDSSPLVATMNLATEKYFETVGIPLIAGRAFTPDEVSNAGDVVIVNETLARRLWDRGDAVGRGIEIPAESRTLRVIGVARDAKYRTLTESAQPHLYRPTPPLLRLTLLARTTHDPREGLRSIQRALDAVGPGVVGFFPRTLDDHLAVQLLPARAAANAATVLGALALALSAAALYALIAWFVVLRRREFGVRLALGARPRDIRALVVRQTLAAVGPGAVAGLVLASLFGMAAESALAGVSASDPLAVAGGIGALMLMVLFAGYFPSRAAATVDPVEALRE